MKIPIFTFHKVCPHGVLPSRYWITEEMLRGQLLTLKSLGYNAITMAELEMMRYGPKPCVLTFDDAYENFLTHAAPLLRQFKMTATVFVPTAYIGKDNSAWEHHDITPVKHLSASEIVSLAREGFDFQPHSHTHTNFRKLTEDQIHDELRASKNTLEDLLQTKCTVTAYPGGWRSEAAKLLVYQTGYRMAVCSDQGIADTETMNHFEIPRLPVYSTPPSC